MKISLTTVFYCFALLACSSNALSGADDDIISSAEQRAINATNGILRSLTSGLTETLEAFDSVKYLDIAVEVQDTLNPAISITNVNSIFENTNSVFFNQNTLSHNKDEQTINFGIGYRKLLNNDKLLLGANIFYDYSFDDNHRRNVVWSFWVS